MAELGQQGNAAPSDYAGDYNAIMFMVRQVIGRANIATLVRVVAVTNTGTLAPFGFVDVQPLVNVLDGAGVVVDGGHGTVYKLPYVRMQGGVSAIILDPAVGDIGVAVFADRDISVVKSTQKAGNAGSARRNSMADGLYMGGILNAQPTQFIRFSADGIEIHAASGKDLTIAATNINITGDVAVTGKVTASGEVKGNGKNLSTHTHGGVTVGAGVTGLPI